MNFQLILLSVHVIAILMHVGPLEISLVYSREDYTPLILLH